MNNMLVKFITGQHPIEECVGELESLIAEIQERDYTFEGELDEIQSIKVMLKENPESDITEFNNLYSFVQSHVSRVAEIYISLLREKGVWQRYKARSKRLYRKARNRLLTTREDIKSLRNKELQEAKVQEEVPELADLEELIDSVIDDLDLMIDIVKEKKEELDKANTNLSRQQKVVESMIGLGYSVKYRDEQ
jgi:hypothetical protein